MRTLHDHRAEHLARFVNLAWGRRLETGLTLAATAARVGLVHLFGTGRGLLVLALGGASFLCYRPTRSWMLRSYRAERTERWAGKAFEAAGLELATAPDVAGWQPTPAGVALDLRLRPRLTAEGLEEAAEHLAVAFGAARVAVRRERLHAGRAQLLVSYRDPLSEKPVPWPWAGLATVDLWGGLPFGYDEDDHLVVLELAGHHLLLGGEPGAGKSNAVSLVVAAAALDPSVELWCFDGKLVELAPWLGCARHFVGPGIEDAASVLKELRAEMEARYRFLLDHGLRKVERSTGLGLVVVVIDELALYLQGKGKARDEVVEVLRDVVARGRAAGIVVVAATQKPASDIIPTSIRDLFGYRMALRCATKDASDTVLGVGWAAQGYSAAGVDSSSRGVGYLLAEGSVPTRMRCFALDDSSLGALATRAEARRREEGR